MAPQNTPEPLPLLPASTAPEQIRWHLAQLIRHYVKTRSPLAAGSIVQYLDLLCAHPRFDGDSAERCAYLRLKAHWRCLARAVTTAPAG